MRLRPTEAIHLSAVAVLAALTVLLRHRLADPGRMLIVYAALAGALLWIAALARREAKDAQQVRSIVSVHGYYL